MSMKKTFEIILLSVILLAAFVIRTHSLGDESLWYDEGLSIQFAHLNLPQLINELSLKETHPPFYYLLLHYWINLFGDSEFSARLLSAIFGALTVLMVYHVGRLLFDKKTGILSAILVSVSGFFVYFSQEVRMYSLLPFLALASMYFFLKLLDKKNIAHAAGYAVFTILLLYTHYTGFFIILAQNIYFITLFLLAKKYSRQDFVKWLCLQILLIVLYAPGIEIIIKLVRFAAVSATLSANPAPITPPPFSVWLILNFFTKACGTSLLSYIFILLSINAFITKRKGASIDKPKFDAFYLLSLWLLCPFAMAVISPKTTSLIYQVKYFSANVIAVYLLAAYGLSRIRLKYVMAPAFAVIIVLSLGNVMEIYRKVNKEPWRIAAEYVDKNARAGDLVIFNPPYYITTVFDYYSKRNDLIKEGFPPSIAGTTYVNERNIKELMPIVGDHERVWFIQAHIHDPLDLTVSALKKLYNIVSEKEYYMVSYYRPADYYIAIKIYLFEKKE